MGRNFIDLLTKRWDTGTAVCVGLDPDLAKIPSAAQKASPGETILAFNKAIIDATGEYVCAYKPQVAYYEAYGPDGIKALEQTIAYINQKFPEVPVIADAKRADIGSTNEAYIKAIFEDWKADAVTLHPYLGSAAIQPFLDLSDKGLIVLCRTSNPGAGEFQDKQVVLTEDEKVSFGVNKDQVTLYEYVGLKVAKEWDNNGNCALVVGATYPEEAKAIRDLVGDIPFLIPGVGAQGGDVEAIVRAAKNSRGQGMIINSARAIIYASNGPDFAERAGEEAKKLRDQINEVLAS